MTFRGRFARLPRRRAARQDLAVLPRRRPGDPPRRRGRQHRLRHGEPRPAAAPRRRGRARTSPTTASWLERHGVDCQSVHVSRDPAHGAVRLHHRRRHGPDRHVLRRRDDRGPRLIELGPIAQRVGGLDLVLIGANDPEAMLRHTEECRTRGHPVHRRPVPAARVRRRPGRSAGSSTAPPTCSPTSTRRTSPSRRPAGAADEIDSTGSTTRVITRGKDGVDIHRKGEDVDRGAGGPARSRKADPTGVGDAFRAGFLAGLAGGLDLRRCAEVGSMLATYVIETVGTQEYAARPGATSSTRLADAYGADSADEIEPRVRRLPDARADPPMPTAPAEPSRHVFDARRGGRRRGEDLVGVGADLAPGTLLAAYRVGLFPMGLGAARRRRRSAGGRPDPRGVLPPARPAASAARCARSLRHVRGARRHRLRRGRRRLRRPRRGRVAGSPPRSPRPTPSCTALGWAHSVETCAGRRAGRRPVRVAIGGLFAGESMFHTATDASKVGARRAGRHRCAADGDPRRLVDVQWRTAAPGDAGRHGGAARPRTYGCWPMP